jgi:prepilin-type N-terminal cleavage/methylation domain-containing protein
MTGSRRGLQTSACRRSRRSGRPEACFRGFTLIEFFVAITIFSFLSLTLIYSLNLALQLHKQGKEIEESAGGVSLIASVMEKEIQRAVVFQDMTLVGSATRIYFCAPISVGGQNPALSMITYALLHNEQGHAIFEKTSENPFALKEGENQGKASVQKFLYSPGAGVDSLSFKYFTFVSEEKKEGETEAPEEADGWVDTWDKPFFPDAVKLEYTSEGSGGTVSEEVIVLPGAWNQRPKEQP